MAELKKEVTKEELKTFFRSLSSWRYEPRYNYFKTVTPKGNHIRLKLGIKSCRLEIKSVGKTEWVRIGGQYYTAIVRLTENTVRIGSWIFTSPSGDIVRGATLPNEGK